MEPEDTPPMSGSNSICVSTVLLDGGLVPMTEPETRLVLEAPGPQEWSWDTDSAVQRLSDAYGAEAGREIAQAL